MKNFIRMLKRIFTVPNTFDTDDLRRRQVLNSVLLVLDFMVLLQTVAEYWNDNISLIWQDPDVRIYLVAASITLLFSVLLLVLNRSSRMPRNLVGWIFVVGMIAIISIADSPWSLTSGNSMFLWVLPVTFSVVILPPASVFVVDVLITIVFLYYAGFSWHQFQSYTLSEVYVVSFISWLGMSIAERAIRDARNASRDAQNEARKNAAILEGVAEGVIVLGPDNQVVLANRAASDLIGSDMLRITPQLEDAQMGGRALSFRWSDVEGVGRVAIVHDISRQIEIDHAKDAILRVVSHEMRTPLSAILGFAEILESRSVPGLATRIRANGQRMLKLVNDLLDVAQIQAGALSMHNESFSPSTLAAYVQEHFLQAAQSKGLELKVELSADLPEQVCGDVQRLEQVLSNLVGNGIKFTNEGGRVAVSLCTKSAREWQIVVQDSGTGIPPERLPDIFEPFRRASDFAKRKQQGVGLGLSIVKKLVQLSGGDVSVESTVGKGSTFTVTLPIHP